MEPQSHIGTAFRFVIAVDLAIVALVVAISCSGCAASHLDTEALSEEHADAVAVVPAAWEEAGLPPLSSSCAAQLEDPRVVFATSADFRLLCDGCAPYDAGDDDPAMRARCAGIRQRDPLFGACVLGDGTWVIHEEADAGQQLQRVQHAAIVALAACQGEHAPATHPTRGPVWCSAWSRAWHLYHRVPSPCATPPSR
jgi:hypothetical protein